MSRVIAFVACGFTLAACSTSLPSLSFLKSSPQTEALRIESEPPGAEAKTSQGQTCRTPCELVVQSGPEMSVTLALSGFQPLTVAVRPEMPSGPPDRDASGGAARLTPNPVYADLVPAPVAPPAKKPPPKKKPATAAVRPAPAPPAAPTTAAV